MVTATVLAAPIIPDAAGIALVFEGHANVSPLLVIKLAWVHPLQQFDQIHLLYGRHLLILQEIKCAHSVLTHGIQFVLLFSVVIV
jgi:hypothetical protein